MALWQTLLAAEAPATVLVGHSMGGAVATRAAAGVVRLNRLPTPFTAPANNLQKQSVFAVLSGNASKLGDLFEDPMSLRACRRRRQG